MTSPSRAAVAVAIACGCGSTSHAPSGTGSGASPVRLATALDTANRNHEPLVVELGATWCKPCHVFADQVLTDPRVQAALAGIVFVQYDIDTPAGAEAMHRCNVTGVPAIVGLDHAGVVQQSRIGSAPTTDEFLSFLRQAATER